jgi:hypothetical protein
VDAIFTVLGRLITPWTRAQRGSNLGGANKGASA